MKTKAIYLLVAALSFGCALLAQETKPVAPSADPFTTHPVEGTVQKPKEAKSGDSAQIRVLWEVFSMEPEAAAQLLREGLDGKPLYDQVLEHWKRKEAVQEAMVVLHSRSGERSLSESLSEIIYPTEYEPAHALDKPAVDPAAKPAPEAPGAAAVPAPAPPSHEVRTDLIVPATPTSFETRNSGWTFEMQAALSEDSSSIDLTIAPSYTVRAGSTSFGQGLGKVEMPIFDSQRLQESITVKPGKVAFAGTFNRSPISTISPETSKRVWLAFVTASVVKQ